MEIAHWTRTHKRSTVTNQIRGTILVLVYNQLHQGLVLSGPDELLG